MTRSMSIPQLLTMLNESVRVQANLLEELSYIFLGPAAPAKRMGRSQVGRPPGSRNKRKVARRSTPSRTGPYSKVAAEVRRKKLDKLVARLPRVFKVDDVPTSIPPRRRSLWVARQVRAGRLKPTGNGTYRNLLKAA